MPQRLTANETALGFGRNSGTIIQRVPRSVESGLGRALATQPPVLIGSAPGAGSTLLSVILDAHPEIACGPELTIFSHSLVYTDFARFKRAARRAQHLPRPDSYRALQRGFAPYSGISNHNAPYYGIASEDFLNCLQSYGDAGAWLNGTFCPWLKARGKDVFVEKSPENIYGMDAFLDAFPTGLAVCLVRHPLDQILSLRRRNFSFGRALSIWLVETALCLQLAKHSRVHLIRYEDLVYDPVSTLDRLCRFLRVSRVEDLAYRYRDDSPRIVADKTIEVASWTLHPGDGIKVTAVGNGALTLTPVEIAAAHQAFIGTPPPRLHAIAGIRLADITARLGYSLPPCPNLPVQDLLRFLAAEMLLPANDIVPRPPWWFQERMVECRSIAGQRISANPTPRLLPAYRIAAFRTHVLLKAIVRRGIVRTKANVKRVIWPLKGYFALPLRPPQPPKAAAGFWFDVREGYKQIYATEFKATCLNQIWRVAEAAIAVGHSRKGEVENLASKPRVSPRLVDRHQGSSPARSSSD